MPRDPWGTSLVTGPKWERLISRMYIKRIRVKAVGDRTTDTPQPSTHPNAQVKGCFFSSRASLNHFYWRKESILRTFSSAKDQSQSGDPGPEMTSLGWDVSSLLWTAKGVSETTSGAAETRSFYLIYSCFSPRLVKLAAWKGNLHSLPFHRRISNAVEVLDTSPLLIKTYETSF